MDTAVAPDLVARFAADVRRIWTAGADLPMRFGVAVSGGPDSLALLLLANAWKPGLAEAATVDHGLRPESAAEAAMVADLCEALSVPHQTLRVELTGGNVQDAARSARYAALGDWAASRSLTTVFTAHHADDQAETVLMRLNRASGLHGLSGIRSFRPCPMTGTRINRPLLGWRKAELEQIVERAGLEPVLDPSNRDDRFDRARLRRQLAEADWLDAEAIAKSASHLADAEFALNWAIGREWGEMVDDSGDGFVYRPSDAPDAIRLGVLERMIGITSGSAVRGGELAALELRLRGGGKATLGRCIVECRRGQWHVASEPGRS